MKFVVDEMPYWQTDCPFYEIGTGKCTLGGDHCSYMEANAGSRDAEECPWLTTQEGVKE